MGTATVPLSQVKLLVLAVASRTYITLTWCGHSSRLSYFSTLWGDSIHSLSPSPQTCLCASLAHLCTSLLLPVFLKYSAQHLEAGDIAPRHVHRCTCRTGSLTKHQASGGAACILLHQHFAPPTGVELHLSPSLTLEL